MRQQHKTILLWGVLVLMGYSIFTIVKNNSGEPQEVGFSEFLDAVDSGALAQSEVDIRNESEFSWVEGKTKKLTNGKLTDDVMRHMRDKEVRFKLTSDEQSQVMQTLLFSWLPMLFLVAFFFVWMRQLQSGGGKAMSFGKSKARLVSESNPKVTFKEVAGVEEAKVELHEIIEFLKDPKKFTRLGGRIPKGVLLMGPPGTGKTLLARAIAGEAGVPFFSISGSDFVEMFVGVGASRVRDLFEQSKKHAPCIIFIDEIDAVGRHRGAGLGGGHDEREQTLNQLLVEMDGFESNEGVILIAATNRPDVLDPALLRPGRFDRRVVVPRPDMVGRGEVLQVHTKKVPLSDDVDLNVLARGTPGFSGADLSNLVNEAALIAARQNKAKVAQADFDEAKDKVLMGAERKSMILSEKEKEITAFHEAGHAIISLLVPLTEPLHKVTIIPRGRALGVTQTLPEEDRYTQSEGRAQDHLAMLFGGRLAEELVFDEITSGAGNDLDVATNLARQMVCEWGMSAKLGPMTFGKKEDPIFLGREIGQAQEYSQATAVEIDQEIKAILMQQYERAKGLMSKHLDGLKRVADALIAYETLDAAEVRLLLDGGTMTREPPKVRMPTREEVDRRHREQSNKAKDVLGPLAGEPDPIRPAEAKCLLRDLAQGARPAAAMGIVNLTPDSFSDGNQFLSPDAALDQARRLVRDGAVVLDLGAESSRPGAVEVSADSERARLMPALKAIVTADLPAAISVDTRRADIAQLALAMGAAMINDISGLPSPAMIAAVRAAEASYVLMHNRGNFSTMHQSHKYTDVLGEVRQQLSERREGLLAQGLHPSQIWLDVGLGFAKKSAENWQLCAGLHAIAKLGSPVLLGASRKRFLSDNLVASSDSLAARDRASAALVSVAVGHGAKLVRVHNVRACREALAVGQALHAVI